MSEYQIWLKEPNGTKLMPILDWHQLDIQWNTNGVGTLVLDIPLIYWTSFDLDNTKKPTRDMRFDIWRSVDGGNPHLMFDTCFYTRHYTRNRDTDTLRIRAKTANTLLERRIVAARPGSSEAKKSGAAAAVLHEIVTEQMANGGLFSISERDWTAGGRFAIGTAVSGSPSVDRAFAYESVIEVCKKIADVCYNLGTYLAFDVVIEDNVPTFKTYLNQRGTDRTDSIVLSESYGNIQVEDDIIDYENEATVVYVGGAGEGLYRQIVAAADENDLDDDLRLVETFHAATQQIGILNLAMEAFKQYRIASEYRTYHIRVLDIRGYQFGVDYFWGDRITLYDTLLGKEYTAKIDTVGLSANSDGETLDIQLDAEEI